MNQPSIYLPYLIELFSYSLSYLEFSLLAAVAMLSGMAKTGVYGAGMVSVPLMALVFGGKDSTGLLLTLLIFADVFGVSYYRRDANWRYLRQLLPAATLGVVIGTYAGAVINDAMFKLVMAVIIVVSVGLMLWQERSTKAEAPSWSWFAPGMGVFGGFTTMVGNLGGPVMALYLLAMRFPKREFIGTAAWFFLTINLIKVPFHVVVWQTIDWNSIALTACFIPLVALGAWLGIRIVALINDRLFRYLVIAMTLVSAIALVV